MFETFLTTCVYEGCVASSNGNDIVVSGAFEPRTGDVVTNSASCTSYCVDITRDAPAPKNHMLHRHDYGIGETMYVRQSPSAPALTLDVDGGTVSWDGDRRAVRWDIQDTDHSISVRCGDAVYVPWVRVLKPTGIAGRRAFTHTSGFPSGKSGGIELLQCFYVLPEFVSFSNLSVQEVPSDETVELTGYFSLLPESPQNPRTHNRDAGAGRWADVDADNCVGTTAWIDHAGNGQEYRRMTQEGVLTDDPGDGWLGGRMVWRVPFGWHRKGTDVDDPIRPVGMFAQDTVQTFILRENGDFKIEKLGHSSERKINNEVYTDGKLGFEGRD